MVETNRDNVAAQPSPVVAVSPKLGTDVALDRMLEI
jgi:hypothetical protein